jgi:WD40 repeat protein
MTGVAALDAGVLTVDSGGAAVIWDAATPAQVHQLDADLTSCCAWPGSGVGLAGTSQDDVRLIGRGPATRAITLPHRNDPQAVSAIAANGRPMQVVAAFQNSEVASAGRHEWRTKARSGMGTAAALDPAGRLAATGHAFGHVHVWNAETGDEVGRWPLHTGLVLALVFGDDGRLYSAGADRSLLAIEPATGRVVGATMTFGSPIAIRTGDNGGLSVLDSWGALYAFVTGPPA